MGQDMFVLEVPLVEKVIRTVLVYALLLVLIRLVGKRGLATVNTLDIVVALLLASAVQNAIIGDDLTLVGGAVSAVALVAMNSAINRLVGASPLAAPMAGSGGNIPSQKAPDASDGPDARPNGTMASSEAGLVDDPRRRQLLFEPGPCLAGRHRCTEAKQNAPT
jgi:hypothetical protein